MLTAASFIISQIGSPQDALLWVMNTSAAVLPDNGIIFRAESNDVLYNPNHKRSGKGKTVETVNRSVAARGW